MKLHWLLAGSAVLAATASAPDARAQARWQIFAVDSNWSNPANWDIVFRAPDPTIDSIAVLGAPPENAGQPTGWAPTANVTVTGTVNAPTTRLGDGADTSGTLTLDTGDTFNVLATQTGGGTTISTGDLEIGVDGGLGTLNLTGGVLTVARSISTPTSGAPLSALSLSGSASVTASYGFLDRQFRIAGPNVSFTTTGTSPGGDGLILGGGGVHTWEFGMTGPSKLNVAGNLDLGGTLKIVTPGYTPAVGTRWTLAESAAIDANDATPTGFGFVDVTGVPGLLPGTAFQVRTGAAGVTGVLTELEVVQEPVLVVNRQTGQATLKNYSPDAATLSFDAYTVRSNLGGLDPAGLAGLDSQNVSPGVWYAANPRANGIGELNASSSLSLAAGQEISLGSIYSPPSPAEFGVENEDLSFDYGTPSGDLVNGRIVYEGLPNNTLVLNVNPATGAAQLLNPTGFEVGIDAYVLSSSAGSLSSSAWSSLDDQNLSGGDWYEIGEIDANQLGELLVDGAVDLVSNVGSVVGIGSPFTSGAAQDLVFQFALAGETALRTGKVVYGALVSPVALPGDYNGDNVVDAADYTVWRDANGTATTLPNDPTPGTVGQSDYDVWSSNYGKSLAPATAVPEPAAAVLAAGLLAAAATRRRN